MGNQAFDQRWHAALQSAARDDGYRAYACPSDRLADAERLLIGAAAQWAIAIGDLPDGETDPYEIIKGIADTLDDFGRPVLDSDRLESELLELRERAGKPAPAKFKLRDYLPVTASAIATFVVAGALSLFWTGIVDAQTNDLRRTFNLPQGAVTLSPNENGQYIHNGRIVGQIFMPRLDLPCADPRQLNELLNGGDRDLWDATPAPLPTLRGEACPTYRQPKPDLLDDDALVPRGVGNMNFRYAPQAPVSRERRAKGGWF